MPNSLNAAALVAVGLYAQGQTGGELFGFAAEDYFLLSGMAIIAVFGDASLIFRKSLSDKHRIARHLWRMCLGFFIAAGSAFTRPGASAFPEAVRDSGVLSLPELLIFVALVFWLARTLGKGPPFAAGRPAYLGSADQTPPRRARTADISIGNECHPGRR